LVAAEAGRTRVCMAVYEWKNGRGWRTEMTPVIDSWENILPALEGRVTFTGEITATAVKQIRAAGKTFHIAPPATSVRRAGYLAEIGWKRLRQNQTDDASTLAPIYLRNPAGT
jgi:tRNA A37 threonylcarbamoyladenosine modification protein TsaB